jgi:heme exporter protein A
MNRLSANGLAKRFGSRRVFKDISFEVETGQSLAVVGPNGSGKSTLVLTLLRAHHPTLGDVTFEEDGRVMDEQAIRLSTALVSPYFNLYDNLTAEENLTFFASVTGRHVPGKRLNETLARVGLEGRGHDLVGAYSSGMKQRLKYAAALLKDPAFLFLDEPTANLDSAGKKIVLDLIEESRADRVVVIATNEPEEQALASAVCQLGV